MPQKSMDLLRIKNALRNSIDGMRFVWAREPAFRTEVYVTALLAGFLALYDPFMSRIALIGSCVLVIVAEVVNTAIEVVIDRISLDVHPMSKAAKDLGSLLVFLAILWSASLWIYEGYLYISRAV